MKSMSARPNTELAERISALVSSLPAETTVANLNMQTPTFGWQAGLGESLTPLNLTSIQEVEDESEMTTPRVSVNDVKTPLSESRDLSAAAAVCW